MVLVVESGTRLEESTRYQNQDLSPIVKVALAAIAMGAVAVMAIGFPPIAIIVGGAALFFLFMRCLCNSNSRGIRRGPPAASRAGSGIGVPSGIGTSPRQSGPPAARRLGSGIGVLRGGGTPSIHTGPPAARRRNDV